MNTLNQNKTLPHIDRAIAIVTVATLLVWSIGLFAFVNHATAASLTEVSNTLSDSRPSEQATSSVQFTHAETFAINDFFEITYPAGFGDVVVGNITCPTDFSESAPSITTARCTATAQVTGGALTTTIADTTNPAAGSYEFQITTSYAGSDDEEGFTRVMIVDSVQMTASIDTSFTFAVFGTATSTTIVGTADTTGATTPTTLPFGTLEPDTEYFLGQELHVATNASNGFVVTLEQFDFMQSATDDTISTFQDYDGTDGTEISTPANWAAPGGTLDNTNEYGHYGLTSRDAELATSTGAGVDDDFTACGDAGTTGCYAGNFNAPRNVFAHTGPVNGDTVSGDNTGLTDHREWTRVGIRMEVTPLQAAAPDYNTELMYIATPTF